MTDLAEQWCRMDAYTLVRSGLVHGDMTGDQIASVIASEADADSDDPDIAWAVMVALYVDDILTHGTPECGDCDDSGVIRWYHGDEERSSVCDCDAGRMVRADADRHEVYDDEG